MSTVIYKYDITGVFGPIQMPKDSKILCCKEQDQRIVLWAECDLDAELEDRKFITFFTGMTIPENDLGYFYVDTVMIGDLVNHVYEVRK
jgi:hypothetical protein